MDHYLTLRNMYLLFSISLVDFLAGSEKTSNKFGQDQTSLDKFGKDQIGLDKVKQEQSRIILW